MRQLIDNLRSFNSKERFFLIGHILGNANFTPSQEFKKSIEDSLGLKIPEEAFTAMDYHLDWIYASLCLTFNNGGESKVFPNTDRIIKAQQEDIDFIIAFTKGNFCHILLIEAKGVAGWINKQLNSKAERFGQIFGKDGEKWPGVKPHFLLLSRQRPKELNVQGWPAWVTMDGQVQWSELPIPPGLRKVTRCDSKGRPDRNGRFWKVDYRWDELKNPILESNKPQNKKSNSTLQDNLHYFIYSFKGKNRVVCQHLIRRAEKIGFRRRHFSPPTCKDKYRNFPCPDSKSNSPVAFQIHRHKDNGNVVLAIPNVDDKCPKAKKPIYLIKNYEDIRGYVGRNQWWLRDYSKATLFGLPESMADSFTSEAWDKVKELLGYALDQCRGRNRKGQKWRRG